MEEIGLADFFKYFQNTWILAPTLKTQKMRPIMVAGMGPGDVINTYMLTSDLSVREVSYSSTQPRWWEKFSVHTCRSEMVDIPEVAVWNQYTPAREALRGLSTRRNIQTPLSGGFDLSPQYYEKLHPALSLSTFGAAAIFDMMLRKKSYGTFGHAVSMCKSAARASTSFSRYWALGIHRGVYDAYCLYHRAHPVGVVKVSVFSGVSAELDAGREYLFDSLVRAIRDDSVKVKMSA